MHSRIIAIALAGLVVPGMAIAQSTLRTEDLVGRWGVAAYWNEADAARIKTQARSFCNQPYVISKGSNGSARMFEAFQGKPTDVVVQSGQIVAVAGDNGKSSKAIQSWDGSTLVFNYIDDEAKRKYGNMVFTRCSK